jgi:tripartite ATP-independent transporter DctM subunit
LIWIIIFTFGVLAILGVPIAYSLAVATTLGFALSPNMPMFIVAHKMVTGIDSFVILAVPLYILAGALMETGGIATRLVRLSMVLIGWVRGGLAMVVVVVEYLFSGLSGSTAADVSAVGSMLIPPMARSGYTGAYAVAVVSAASAMGMLVPPCINMVVAGAIANVSVGALFFGGFIPAIVLAICIMILIYWQARRHAWKAEERVTISRFFQAWTGAIIPLGMPVIIFGGILGGIVTPTEAGMLAVAYALIVGMVVYREINLRKLYHVLLEAAISSGVIGMLVGIASVFAWMMAAEKIPETILKGMLSFSTSPIVFLLLSAGIFLVIGSFLEGLPAIVVLLPTMFPLVEKLGLNPIHYVNVIIAAVGIGLFLPPIGLGVLIACSIGKIDVTSATRALAPFLVVLLLGLFVLILFPSITLFLPRLAGLVR